MCKSGAFIELLKVGYMIWSFLILRLNSDFWKTWGQENRFLKEWQGSGWETKRTVKQAGVAHSIPHSFSAAAAFSLALPDRPCASAFLYLPDTLPAEPSILSFSNDVHFLFRNWTLWGGRGPSLECGPRSLFVEQCNLSSCLLVPVPGERHTNMFCWKDFTTHHSG